MICYNPLDKFYKSQIGAVRADKQITFRVKGNFNSVVLLLKKDGNDIDERFSLINNGEYFECNIRISVGLYFYCFLIDDNKFIGLGEDYLGVITDTPKRFQLTAYSKNFCVPAWIKGGVIYQIFPDRFYRVDDGKKISSDKIMHNDWLDTPFFEPNEFGQVVNNDFFGGNIKGIIEKLSYLHELGTTVIYLNPIFKAFSNHRYDTGDYMTIDPLLGNIDDFKELISKANEYGIKIVLDGVFNHTGDDSVYFNKYGKYPSLGAYQSKDSKYYGWYDFVKHPDEYSSWWGINVLPAVNEDNPDYIDFISGKDGVIDYYTKLGIGGWRLDVVDELPAKFVRAIRDAAKGANPNAIIIGEVWEDASNKISYGVRREYFQGRELDSVMNYPLKNAIIDFVKYENSKMLSLTVKEQIDHYPKAVLHSLMNILSTHDTFRLITAVGGESAEGKSKAQMSKLRIPEREMAAAKFKVKAASLLQFTLCGVPSIYYGDEIGMQGYADPLNRLCYPWGNEDKEILEWYKFLGKLRSEYDAFVDGDYINICEKKGVFIFVREGKTSQIAVAVNVSDKPLVMQFEGCLYNLLDEKKYKNEYTLSGKSLAIFINDDF